MKVWEETWKADVGDPRCSGASVVFPLSARDAQFGREHGPPGEHWYEADETDVARARLAAAAPEMARLLTRIERLHDSESADDIATAICIEWLPEIRAVLTKAGMMP